MDSPSSYSMDTEIITGTLYLREEKKLFSRFNKRYVELVCVLNEEINEAAHYEMRIYKKSDSTQYLYSLILNPISMNCHIIDCNSSKHQFAFCCSFQRKSICFSANSEFERNAWFSVLAHLQMQFQPNIDIETMTDSPTISSDD